MKLEGDLREGLGAEAERLEPAAPPVKLIARRGRRRSRLKRTGLALSVIALLGAAGVVGRFVLDTPERKVSAFSPVLPGPPEVPAYGPPENEQRHSLIQEKDALEAQAAKGGQATEQLPAVDIGVGPKVIKTATLEIEVEDGAFQTNFGRAQDVADKYGGFITSSSTSGEEARSGELTIRVPARDFEAALHDLRQIGVLESDEVKGEDVTSDFVDLKARLRQSEAEERVLLRLLDDANSIGETLTVRRVLDEVQLDIERIKGQLRLLRDQTGLGTISVAIHEEGVAPAKGSELAGAWGRAIEGAEDVLVAIVVGLGYVLPILVLLLLVWLALRAIRSRVAT
jgi:hypothetical protein